MSLKHTFSIDGASSTLYDTYVANGTMFNSAERDVITEHLYGKNGDIISDNGAFRNRVMTYDCWIKGNFAEQFNLLRGWLANCAGGYHKIKDTINPDYFHMGRVTGIIEPQRFNRSKTGQFTIQFDCKPQYFLESGDTARTVATQITNPTAHPCLPLLELSGTGTCEINGQEIVVDSSCPYSTIIIDCEDMDAYDKDTGALANNYVTLPLDNIKLDTGVNTVTRSGITLTVTPRWFHM